ncbi:MAG: CBS domain-containing protein [Candidatus Lokiarchaeota archaeon]|nr:CBS domain-containing protein [Candidatus Lokiarchaeota archaeon]
MRIGEIKGIEIKLHFSTLAIVGLVAFYSGYFYYSLFTGALIWIAVIIGIINGFIILGSILAHELMHSLVAQKYGLGVQEIEFHMFGGVSKIEEEPKNPKSEALISIVGPLISLGLGCAILAIYYLPQILASFVYTAELTAILYYSGFSNFALGIFNLLPAFPMDGGRLLRAWIWKRRKNLLSATRAAANVGIVFGYGMVGFGFIEMFLLGVFSSFWLVIIGLFLSSSARQAKQQVEYDVKLQNVNSKNIMHKSSDTIPHDMKINDVISQFMNTRRSFFPVSEDHKIVGIITINNIQKLPPEQRSKEIAGNLMTDISKYPTINQDRTAKKAYRKLSMLETDPRVVLVHDDENNIVGYIGEREISSALRISDLFFDESS